MKLRSLITLFAAGLIAIAIPAHPAHAADEKKPEAPAPTAAKADSVVTPPPMTMKEVKQKLGMIVYPAKGQTAERQEADEESCLVWAADQTGLNPNAPAPDAKAAGKQAAAATDSATAGVAVKSAAKGAAAGAIFGAIVGDAGTGAAIGAASGAIGGRRARKQASKQAEAQAEQQAKAAQQAKMDTLKKAMSACLESKGYTIK
jgi:hypothetical protein